MNDVTRIICTISIMFLIMPGICGLVIADEIDDEYPEYQNSDMNSYIISGFDTIAPIYTDLREHLAVNDYYEIDAASRSLIRASNSELAKIGYTDKSSKNEFRNGLSKTDKLLYNKYKAYLLEIRSLGANAQTPIILWRKENGLSFDLMDKEESFLEVRRAAGRTTVQLGSLLGSCKFYHIDCNENSSNVKALKREFMVI